MVAANQIAPTRILKCNLFSNTHQFDSLVRFNQPVIMAWQDGVKLDHCVWGFGQLFII